MKLRTLGVYVRHCPVVRFSRGLRHELELDRAAVHYTRLARELALRHALKRRLDHDPRLAARAAHVSIALTLAVYAAWCAGVIR
jgi:hypothetical protein